MNMVDVLPMQEWISPHHKKGPMKKGEKQSKWTNLGDNT
jgi:hypothetical protein